MAWPYDITPESLSFGQGQYGPLMVGEGGLDASAFPMAMGNASIDQMGLNASNAITANGLSQFGAGGMTAAAAGAGGGGFLSGFGNWAQQPGNLSSLVQGIGALGQLWLGSQQLGLAKDNFRFQKGAFNANLANSIASYNTALEDRIRGRTSAYDGKEADVQNYLNKNKLASVKL